MKFEDFPKMARLSREIIITEKIDGTNSSIFIQRSELEELPIDQNILFEMGGMTVRAGSRTKWITHKNDNYGFASWVVRNAEELIKLGEGHHFGEWWGSGIQRGYGLPKGEKRFSLFNTYRWADDGIDTRPSCCHVVPILYKGEFDTRWVNTALGELAKNGSYAAPDYQNPEGIIVWHTAANIGFKKTIKDDQLPKSLIKL